MKTRVNRFVCAGVVAAAVLLMGAARADASIIVSFLNTTPSGLNFMNKYDVRLGSGQALDRRLLGQFFTIYDFYHYISGSAVFTPSGSLPLAAAFTLCTQDIGITPAT